MTCAVCCRTFSGNAYWVHGHFVCDDCHAAPVAEVIRRIAMTTQSRDPVCNRNGDDAESSRAHARAGTPHTCLCGTALRVSEFGRRNLPSVIDEMLRRVGCNGARQFLLACRNLRGSNQCRDVLLHHHKNESVSTESWGVANLLADCRMPYSNMQYRRSLLL